MPGATRVYERSTAQLKKCDFELCPYQECESGVCVNRAPTPKFQYVPSCQQYSRAERSFLFVFHITTGGTPCSATEWHFGRFGAIFFRTLGYWLAVLFSDYFPDCYSKPWLLNSLNFFKKCRSMSATLAHASILGAYRWLLRTPRKNGSPLDSP